MRAAIGWCFRDRRTGRYVIAQWPNLQLGVFLVATVTSWFVERETNLGRIVGLVATVALGWWAAAEIWSGVNPWRRALGAVGAVLVVKRIVHA